MLERKKVKSWLKSVSAFANTDGGSLFYGVNDDGIINCVWYILAGIDYSPDQLFPNGLRGEEGAMIEAQKIRNRHEEQ